MNLYLRTQHYWFFAVMLMLASFVVLQACASNPISTAKTAEQKAFATYGTFVVFEEQAAALVADQNIPVDVKKGIQEADAKAKPVADSLLAASMQAISMRKAFENNETTVDKLQTAVDNLDRWITESRPLIEGLVEAVEGGK